MFWTLISAAVIAAIADWVAVSDDNRRLEQILKPLTMVLLIGAALVMDEPSAASARWWLVAALALSLLGDVFLMRDDRFVEGLGSFLVAHILYIVTFVVIGADSAGLFVLGAVAVAMAIRLLGVRILKGAVEADRSLGFAVAAYILVISLMVVVAFATGNLVLILGAILFYASDSLIGWRRFVAERSRDRVAIMVTYHLAQVALVIGVAGAS